MGMRLCERIPAGLRLNIPVCRDRSFTAGRDLRVCAGTDTVFEGRVTLSPLAEMWISVDLTPWEGRPLEAAFFDGAEGAEEQLSLLQLGPADPGAAARGHERLRPLVHFTCPQGYHNDPNGLFVLNGVWHMFYQYNPYGLGPGNTSWAHAVSRDLLHWEDKGIVLAPSEEDGYIYSGSAVVDRKNSSGLGVDGVPPVLLFYTAVGFRWSQAPGPGRPPMAGHPAVQRIMVSTDGGESFHRLDGPPAVDFREPLNRDPKVQWAEEIQSWVMALYLKGNRYELLRSEDLLHWEHWQEWELPGTAECPDLFPLDLDGDPEKRRWVLFGSPFNYMVGVFTEDGFQPETELIPAPDAKPRDWPRRLRAHGSYAPQTFFGVDGERALQISWVTTHFPGMPFQSCMSLPWELRLVSTAAGPRLSILPAREIRALERERLEISGSDAAELNRGLAEFPAEALRLELRFRGRGRCALSVRGVTVAWDAETGSLLLPNGVWPLPAADGTLEATLLLDRGGTEIFAADGLFRTVLAQVNEPDKLFTQVLELREGELELKLIRLAL